MGSVYKKKTAKKGTSNSEHYLAIGFISLVLGLLFLIFALDFIKSPQGAEQTLTDRSVSLDNLCWERLKHIGIKRSHAFKRLQTLRKKKGESFFYFEYAVSVKKGFSSAPILKVFSNLGSGVKLEKFTDILNKNVKRVTVDLSLDNPDNPLLVTNRFIFVGKKQRKTVVKKRKKKRFKIAFLIDDIGYSANEPSTFFKISPLIGLSIIPGLPFSRKAAKAAKANGQIVMLHLPMEPKKIPVGYSKRKGAEKEHMLFTKYSDGSIRKKMARFFRELPEAIGVNNHMGSKFTENRRKMTVVLSEVKKRGFFFIDSLTSSHSTGISICSKIGLPHAARDVFIDNSNKPADIAKQMKQIIKKASGYGEVIAIGHPRTNTINALRKFVGNLDTNKFVIVPITELVKGYK